MSKLFKINTSEFEKNLDLFESKISEVKKLIEDINNEMSKVDGTHLTIWSGKAQEILYNHYKKIASKFPEIENRLEEYDIFLKNTLSLYKQEENVQEKSVDIQADELDVI